MRIRILGLAVLAGTALGAPAADAQSVAQAVQASRGTIFQVGQFTSALATINGGFFNQNSTFVSAPLSQSPDQFGAGAWVRATGGTFDTAVPGTLSGAGPATTTRVRTDSNYSGIQAAADVARYNLGNSGYTLNVGITGGQVNIQSTGPDAPGIARFAVPFVGGYLAVSGNNFFFDALVREDFFDLTTSTSSFGFSTTATTGATSVGYRFDFPDFYVTPSAAFSYTNLDGGSRPTAAAGAILPGSLTLRPIVSELGRVNVTVGKDFAFRGYSISPFATASVFNEFADPATVRFAGSVLTPVGAQPLNLAGTLGRVGTYGQFSVGSSLRVNTALASGLENDLLSFVRFDYRIGDRTEGYGVTGGVRYQF